MAIIEDKDRCKECRGTGIEPHLHFWTHEELSCSYCNGTGLRSNPHLRLAWIVVYAAVVLYVAYRVIEGLMR